MSRAVRLLMIGIILSTLLCAGTMALWLRSYWRYDQAIIGGEWIWMIRSDRGAIHLLHISNPLMRFREIGGVTSGKLQPAARPFTDDLSPIHYAEGATSTHDSFAGIHVDRMSVVFRIARKPMTSSSVFQLDIPYVYFAAIAATPGLLWLFTPLRRHCREVRRRRERRERRCIACGYDLRATPNRCPECGRAA